MTMTADQMTSTGQPGGFVEAPDGTLVHFIDLDLHAGALHTDVSDPIILIHGLGCGWHHYSRQIGWLAHARRVVAVDMRGGAGETRWTRPGWSTADMAADVHTVVTELGLHRPAIVGCSMGGTIALQYALDYPADLSRLVALASFGWLPDSMSQTVDEQMAFIRDHSMREIAENRIGAAFTGDVDQDVKSWMVNMVASCDKEGYQSEAETTLYFDVHDRLNEIRVPTTVIHGEQDHTVPVAVGQALAGAVRGAALHILPGEGHYAIVQAPEKVNPLLAAVLGIPQELVPRR